MITQLTLENFKAFKKQAFDCKKLNIFTGINGVGKSTVLQSLLLLRQSYIKRKLEVLLLNGEYTSIGTGKDILYSDSDEYQSIHILLQYQNMINQFIFDYIRESEKEEKLKQQIAKSDFLRKNLHTSINNNFLESSLFSFDSYFHYLSADRLGPEDINDTSSEYVIERKELGIRGEYSLDFLENFKTVPLDNPFILHPETTEEIGSNTLGVQTNLWLSEISYGVKLNTYYMPEIKKVRGTFQFSRKSGYSEEYTTKNVGFGLTYVLPVLLALLTSKKNGIVLIENPESHLHPAGQSKIAELIVRCAASGRQVFIETHSDHIIYGIMIAAYEYYKERKKENHNETIGISNEDVSIYYFSHKEESNFSNVEKVNLTETGRIKKPPKGFCDQFNIDMKRLL